MIVISEISYNLKLVWTYYVYSLTVNFRGLNHNYPLKNEYFREELCFKSMWNMKYSQVCIRWWTNSYKIILVAKNIIVLFWNPSITVYWSSQHNLWIHTNNTTKESNTRYFPVCKSIVLAVYCFVTKYPQNLVALRFGG